MEALRLRELLNNVKQRVNSMDVAERRRIEEKLTRLQTLLAESKKAARQNPTTGDYLEEV